MISLEKKARSREAREKGNNARVWVVEVVKGEEVTLRRDDPPITNSVLTACTACNWPATARNCPAAGSAAEQKSVRLKARVQAVVVIRYGECTGYAWWNDALFEALVPFVPFVPLATNSKIWKRMRREGIEENKR